MVITADALDPGAVPPGFKEWCVVELFGHQRFAGLVSQADWPAGFARLEVPATPGHGPMTQILSPNSIYRLSPTTEAIARVVAEECRPEPVSRYELEAASAAPVSAAPAPPDAWGTADDPFDDDDPDLDTDGGDTDI